MRTRATLAKTEVVEAGAEVQSHIVALRQWLREMDSSLERLQAQTNERTQLAEFGKLWDFGEGGTVA